jgi:hypothetical protein
MAHFASKYCSFVNQKAEKIPKWRIFWAWRSAEKPGNVNIWERKE